MAKTTFNLRVDEQLKQQFQAKCKDTGETATQVMERAMKAYIDDESLQCNDSNDECNDSNDERNDGAKKPDAITYDALLYYSEGLACDIFPPTVGNRPGDSVTSDSRGYESEFVGSSNTNSQSNKLGTKDISALTGKSTRSVVDWARKAIADETHQFTKQGMTFQVTYQPKNRNESWEFEQIG